MKTLDEVIKAMEYCQTPDQMGNCNVNCPYIHCCDPESVAIKTDALHYLREYRAILPLVPSIINTALEVQKKGKTIG